MKNNKRGISLIVLVITVTSTYNETTKYRKVPPKSKIKIIDENKTVGCKLTVFYNVLYMNLIYYMV